MASAASIADAAVATSAELDGVDLEELARRAGTPLYVYSAARIRERIAALQEATAGLDALICFAVKANPTLAVLGMMADAGLGADIVSAGELWRALRAGIAPARIVFSGVGKKADEIDAALEAGILRFNVESRDELALLQERARHHRLVARAAVRINPDVDALTHAKISTGKAENKFGVSIADARAWFARRERFPAVRLDGLHVHIGSQILALGPYAAAFSEVAAFVRELAAGGHRIESIDVGGGLGIRYRADDERPIEPRDYVATIRRALGDFRGRFVFEPGRWLVADAGLLLTRVIRLKQGGRREFLVVDAAMNDLMRPSLYDAWHEIGLVSAAQRGEAVYDVVGPVCESSDTFAHERRLPRCEPGDLLAIRDVGAYGTSMSSTFNSRQLAAEVMVDGGRYAVARRRQTFEEMVAGELAGDDWQVLS